MKFHFGVRFDISSSNRPELNPTGPEIARNESVSPNRPELTPMGPETARNEPGGSIAKKVLQVTCVYLLFFYFYWGSWCWGAQTGVKQCFHCFYCLSPWMESVSGASPYYFSVAGVSLELQGALADSDLARLL